MRKIALFILLMSASIGFTQETYTPERNKPCDDCYEKLELRTDSTSYFVEIDNEKKFYLVYYPQVKNYDFSYSSDSAELATTALTRATVTTTGTLATGDAMYNATGTWINACSYALTVATPPNSTITDIVMTFGYETSGFCWLEDGAWDIDYLACRTPAAAGFFWFCNVPGGGTCDGSNISVYSDFSACVPGPSCAAYDMDFTLNFYEKDWGTPGCSPDCIAASMPWTMVIEGETVDNTALAGGVSGTIAVPCSTDVNLDAGASFGVPGYDYLWSNGETTPTQTVNHGINGTYTYSVLVTDACGETSTSSVDIVVTGCSATLPVELVHFEGKNISEGNKLNWETLSETNNEKFIIQRSENGIDWLDLGNVPGAGNSSSIIQYEFLDDRPLIGLNYYRLKQVDFDGEETLSDVLTIDLRNRFVIFPNPAKDQITLVLKDEKSIPLNLQIVNAQGEIVLTQYITSNYSEVDISKLNNGVYFVRMFDGESLFSTEKLVIK